LQTNGAGNRREAQQIKKICREQDKANTGDQSPGKVCASGVRRRGLVFTEQDLWCGQSVLTTIKPRCRPKREVPLRRKRVECTSPVEP
jgi:hypothetical protein